jgi:hypothetical protein
MLSIPRSNYRQLSIWIESDIYAYHIDYNVTIIGLSLCLWQCQDIFFKYLLIWFLGIWFILQSHHLWFWCPSTGREGVELAASDKCFILVSEFYSSSLGSSSLPLPLFLI